MALYTHSAMRLARLLRLQQQIPSLSRHCHRYSSTTTASEPDLKATLASLIPEKRELLKQVKSRADHKIGDVKVENVIGGMRGLKSLIWEGSVLDAEEGIRFRGYTIAECRRLLPKAKRKDGKGDGEILPEGMFWLLLTGQIPSEGQVKGLSAELMRRWRTEKSRTGSLLSAIPSDTHPMAQLSIAVTALSKTSQFAKGYAAGKLSKEEYWEATLDDSISLIAKLPAIAAYIYRRSCRKGQEKLPAFSEVIQEDADWSYNFSAMMGYAGQSGKDEGFQDLLRLYMALHADHEGGNVSAHATHLVGSALSDPFLSYSAGLQGLAGPLHGLAAQEVLRFLLKMQEAIGSTPSPDAIRDHLWSLLRSGQVIPGYGHAVLRAPDPRFTALTSFGASRPSLASDPLFQLVQQVSEIAPSVLTEHGKTKNPNPNVDAASGAAFWCLGMRETLFLTVIFGVGRALGPLAQLIWDRALGLPIERPKSVDLKGLLTLTDDTA